MFDKFVKEFLHMWQELNAPRLFSELSDVQCAMCRSQLHRGGARLRPAHAAVVNQWCMEDPAKVKAIRGLQPTVQLTRMVLKSPSRKFLKGVRKLMAALWMNSRSAPPICFCVSPHFIRAFPVIVSTGTGGHFQQGDRWTEDWNTWREHTNLFYLQIRCNMFLPTI